MATAGQDAVEVPGQGRVGTLEDRDCGKRRPDADRYLRLDPLMWYPFLTVEADSVNGDYEASSYASQSGGGGPNLIVSYGVP